MSSSDSGQRHTLTGRRLMLAMALSAAAAAGGCFQPLYADNTRSITGGSVKDAFKEIEVPEIKGLIGHYLRNELVFELDGGNEPDRAKRLTFQTQISEAIEVVTVDYANGRADSAILVATATWSLTDTASGKVVSKGSNVVRRSAPRATPRSVRRRTSPR